MMKIKVAILISCVFLALSGCAMQVSQVQTNPLPDLSMKTLSTLSFTRLIFRVPSGKRIGAHHDGLLKVPQYQHVWQAGMIVGSEEFKIIASEHLRVRGCNVLGGDNTLFGSDESMKAEYQLGGTVTNIEYSTYAPLAGNSSEAMITVEWKLYNTFTTDIVYSKTASGYGQQTGIGVECIHEAFRISLDNLLSDQSFISQLELSPFKQWDTTGQSMQPISIHNAPFDEALIVPQDLDDLLNTVVMLKVGNIIGSGVLISDDGWIITAAHVVANREDVTVHLHSGVELLASVEQLDSHQDIALIKLPGKGYCSAHLTVNQKRSIGSDVYVIGAPSGSELAFSVSKGIISGFREWNGSEYIQTDAALNPGNSGGPIFDDQGCVIGIISWKIVAPGFEGLSFGVPVDAVLKRLNIVLN